MNINYDEMKITHGATKQNKMTMTMMMVMKEERTDSSCSLHIFSCPEILTLVQ